MADKFIRMSNNVLLTSAKFLHTANNFLPTAKHILPPSGQCRPHERRLGKTKRNMRWLSLSVWFDVWREGSIVFEIKFNVTRRFL